MMKQPSRRNGGAPDHPPSHQEIHSRPHSQAADTECLLNEKVLRAADEFMDKYDAVFRRLAE
jgi:hypothetical protein